MAQESGADGEGEEPTYTVPDRDRLRQVAAPQPLRELLELVVARRSWGERVRGGRVLDDWVRVVGEELAEHCRPVRLSGGILVVRARSQAWATELSYLRDRIRRSANALVGEELVDEVQVTVGDLDDGDNGDEGDSGAGGGA